MVSISTLIILAAASVAIGPKQLPKAARIFGRLTGRTVKFIGDLRLTLNQSRDSEVMRLKSDLEQVVNQFTQIQSEVKRGLTLRGGHGGGTATTNTAAASVRHTASSASSAPSAAQATTAQATATEATVTPPRQTGDAIPTQNMGQTFASRSDATVVALESHPPSFANAFASLHQSNRVSDDKAGDREEENRKQFMRQLKEVQESSMEKHGNPYSWDEAEEQWAREQFRRHRGKSVDNPFASVSLGHQPLNDLYEDGSSGIHTETMGSGADILSKNILERHFAEFHAGLEKDHEGHPPQHVSHDPKKE